MPDRPDQSEDVLGDGQDRVVPVGGFARRCIPTKVRSNGAVTGGAEPFQDPVPAVSRVREAVEKQHQGAGGTRLQVGDP